MTVWNLLCVLKSDLNNSKNCITFCIKNWKRMCFLFDINAFTCRECCLYHLPQSLWRCAPWRGQRWGHTGGSQGWPSQSTRRTVPDRRRSSPSNNTDRRRRKRVNYSPPPLEMSNRDWGFLTVVVLRMISGSSRSSGTTSSTNRGTVGGAGGGARGVMAAFLALEKNLVFTVEKKECNGKCSINPSGTFFA